MADGPETPGCGCSCRSKPTWIGYHLFHSARADLLRRAGRTDDAAEAYRRALDLTTNDAERRFLERRLDCAAASLNSASRSGPRPMRGVASSARCSSPRSTSRSSSAWSSWATGWLNHNPRLWKPFMIAASYVFYGWWNWRFVLLLAGVTLRSPRSRRSPSRRQRGASAAGGRRGDRRRRDARAARCTSSTTASSSSTSRTPRTIVRAARRARR